MTLDSQITFECLRGGDIRVTKDGESGVGTTLAEALHDLANKLTLTYFQRGPRSST